APAPGPRPFTGPGARAIMRAIAPVDPPPPSTLRPGLPPGFDQIVRRALAKDREQRHGSAAELAEALRGLSAPAPLTVPAPAAAGQAARGEEGRQPEETRPQKRRGVRRLAAVTAAAAVVAAALGGWFCWHQANVNWARANVARVEELANAENYFEAYDLAVRVQAHLPDDPTLARLLPLIADELSVT